jgi:hypothetical protein
MDELIDFKTYYWDRLYDYPSELNVDARWVLRKISNDRTYGSLRIVSHPDLPPAHLRAFFRYVLEIKDKTDIEYIKTLEAYQIKQEEMEIYSVDKDFKTDLLKYEAPFKELEEIFNIKIFE